MESLFKRMF